MLRIPDDPNRRVQINPQRSIPGNPRKPPSGGDVNTSAEEQPEKPVGKPAATNKRVLFSFNQEQPPASKSGKRKRVLFTFDR